MGDFIRVLRIKHKEHKGTLRKEKDLRELGCLGGLGLNLFRAIISLFFVEDQEYLFLDYPYILIRPQPL